MLPQAACSGSDEVQFARAGRQGGFPFSMPYTPFSVLDTEGGGFLI